MRRLLIAVLAVGVHVSALAAEHGVKMVDAAWMRAANANDLEAMMACYADNAVLYPPDSMEAKGKDAIRESFRGMLAAFTIREARIVSATYETRGDISTGWGRFVLTLVPKAGGEPMAMEGRFTEVAQKKGNRWYYIADHASLPLPPPPDASKPAP
jgi:uncharacterized protein (TIGR02246 family)